MFHYLEAITDKRGNGLTGYCCKLIDPATGSVVSIYSDDAGTPIINVSGIANTARVDNDGNVSLYTVEGIYHLDIYAADAATFIRRIDSVQMGVTIATVSWGDIIGTIGDQPDLTTALAAKASTSSLGYFATGTDAANLTGTVAAGRIADASLSIAKTSGLQSALDGKQAVNTNLTSLASLSLAGKVGFVPKVNATGDGFVLAADATGPGGSGVNDGTYGDITVSGTGTLFTINANAVTLGKLATQAANTVLANATASSATPTAVALSASQLLGRGSTGNVAPITLGTGLSMSGTTLNASGAALNNPQITGNIFIPQAAPPTIGDGGATLTIAQLLGGLILTNQTSAITLTLPTGANCDAGILGGALPVDYAFDWTVLNTGTGAAAFAPSAGHTLTGSAGNDTQRMANQTAGRWRTVKTAANTFVTYRIA